MSKTPERATAYCLLGSNLGDRTALLREATFLLGATPGIEVAGASRVYETPPWGRTGQPPFLNAAAQLQTSLDPQALLARFLDAERRLGRRRAAEDRWGPRPIDLDLALYGDQTIESPGLAVPHPRLTQRAFALVPLLEIAPKLRAPGTGEPYRAALARLDRESIASCRAVGPLLVASGRAPSFEPGLYLSRSPRRTQRLARGMGAAMQGGEVVAMAGALGAGKTCFAGGFARGLGIETPIASPSYVLLKTYEGGRLVLHHADFYRLSEMPAPRGVLGTAAPRAPQPAGETDRGVCGGPEPPDLASVGLEDYLGDPGAVLLIEWADRFPAWLEPPFWLVEIARTGAEARLLHIRRIDAAPREASL